MSGTVRVLEVASIGGSERLLVGGDLEVNVNDTSTSGIAAWDGSEWTAFGQGIDGGVRAVKSFSTKLIVGGFFDQAGGIAVQSLASWDGLGWSKLGGGDVEGGGVEALAVFNPGSGEQLVVAGPFLGTETVHADGLMTWDGVQWSAMVEGLGVAKNQIIRRFCRKPGGPGAGLYAAGSFDRIGGEMITGVARLDDQGWHALGQGIDGAASFLVLWDDGGGPALYVGGSFTTAGGVSASGLARWDGATWQALAGPLGNGVGPGSVVDAAVYDDGSGDALFFVGMFEVAGGVTVNRVARWDGTDFAALEGSFGNGILGGIVLAAAVYDDGSGPKLYVAGTFDTAGGLPAQKIASWDGQEWTSLPGVQDSGIIKGLVVHDDGSGSALYAVGSFALIGGKGIAGVARWNGTAWSAVGTGGPLSAIGVESILLATGASHLFVTNGSDLMSWDGTAWATWPELVEAEPPYDGIIFELCADHTFAGDSLLLGGQFTWAADLPSSGMAAMDCFQALFIDGFERGDSSAWTVP